MAIDLQITEREVGGKLIKTVLAGEFHKAIGCGSEFMAWVQYRIKKHGFKDGVDYVEVVDDVNSARKDYIVSLDVASKLAVSSAPQKRLKVVEILYTTMGVGSELAVVKPRSFAPPAGVKTMSSVEIVEVINALRGAGRAEMRHDNFMAKVVEHPGINALNFQGVYFGGNGESRPCYYLPKREAELMVMSESLEVQTKVYDRLTELEENAPAVFKLPQSYSEALLELAANVQRTEALQLENAQKSAQIAAAAPAVEFVEKYVAIEDNKTFRQVAKLLAAPEVEFRAFLLDRRFMYKLNNEYLPYSNHQQAGHFTVKATVVDNTSRIRTYRCDNGLFVAADMH